MLTKVGVLNDVGQYFDGFGYIGFQSFGVEDGLFAGRVRVQMGADVFDFQFEGGLRSGRGALGA